MKMRPEKSLVAIAAALILLVSVSARADNNSYSFTGGAFSAGTVVGGTVVVKSALLSVSGATLTFSCPITMYGAGTYQVNWACKGGSVLIATGNKSLTFQGAFTSAAMTLSASGGGKGSHFTDSYQFNGEFSGTIAANGVTQAAHGSIAQLVQTGSPVGTGSAPVTSASFGWSSAYSPLLAGDNAKGRIVGADNLNGANLSAYGSLGSGTGQFTSIAGLTEDAMGRIYATDSTVNRVVRIDDLTGKNWLEIGSYGVGANHFKAPAGVVVDASGKIWVVDSGNSRIVRFDDMSGTNWTSFGTAGSGKNQFQNPTGIALDAQGLIYVADTGNNRVVRFDDITGKNWVSFSEVFSGSYGYLLTSPESVAVNSTGQVYIALGGTYGYLIKAVFPTGANSTVSKWSNPLTSISLDKAGAIYVTGQFSPGLAEVNDAASTGYFASAFGGAVQQPGPVYARPSSTPPPADPVLSVSTINFGSHNVGEPSARYPVVLRNLGGTALTVDSISTGSDFPVSNNCLNPLAGGSACTISVQFDPKQTGPRPSDLVVNSNGVHPAVQVALIGVGTTPNVVVLPGALSFVSQKLGTSSGASAVTLTNVGTGTLTIASIVASGEYTQTNNCGKGIAAKGGCTINVVFQPTSTGTQAGALTISDDAIPTGTHQTVTLTGVGTSAIPAVALSPESVQFPDQKIGTTSAIQKVVVSNLSGVVLTLGAPAFPAGFKVSSTCGASLTKGASCTFSVAFAPTEVGPVSGAITIPITGQPTLHAGLSGTGTSAGKAPTLKFTPATVTFGSVAIGDNPSLSVTVTNTSGLSTGIQSSALTGATSFTIAHNTCPSVLAAGATCTVSIMFVPTSSIGSYSGVFTIVEGTGAQIQAKITGDGTSGSN
jgi:hypothetical protein